MIDFFVASIHHLIVFGIAAVLAAELAARVADLVAPGDIVLVKGSKSSKISTVVDALRKTAQTPALDTKE